MSRLCKVMEEILMAGRRGRMGWTLRGREATHRRSIDGRMETGGTIFDRAFVYTDPLMRLLDRLVLEAGTGEALLCLKAVPERRAA